MSFRTYSVRPNMDIDQLRRDAVIHNDLDLLRWFSTRDKIPNLQRAPELAVAQASIEIVNILIEHGAQVESSMALHYALFRADHDSRLCMMEHFSSLE